MISRPSPFAAGHLRRAIAPVRRFFSWYWRGLKHLPAFSAGYVVGGIVVATMIVAPSLARLALAWVP